MLSKLRDFSKSKLAGVLITIIIIPFVFWGMGSVFSGGNTNNVVKINNKKISTQDFIEHINTSNIDPDQLRKNLDKNVLEEILGQLISLNILKMEIQNLGIIKSDKSLSESIIKEERFLDDDDKLEEIYNKIYDLSEFTAPDQFKTYEELKSRLDSVLARKAVVVPTQSVDEELEDLSEGLNRPSSAELDEISNLSAAATASTDEEEDDALSYFQKLAEE